MRALAILLTAVVCFGENQLSNRRAPGFSLPDSNLKRYDLQDFRGKWVLIDFILTNCPHCEALGHTLEDLKRRNASRVAVLTVVIAPPETQETVKRFIKDNHVTVPVLFDQGQMAASYFQATPENPSFDTPHLFVIDPSGAIVRDRGHSDEKDAPPLEGTRLVKELEALFNARP